ncbi:hypothetical protein KY360_03980 [Candidatus Woesearchaeota archaeon]|nr:hypothetical protein [Candidatus Woesearchaeota archaeon]
MKKAILTTIFIMTLIALAGCAQKQEGQKLSADKVDFIPDVSISECKYEAKAANPEMSEQDVNDNCYTIEAVNKGDKALCDQVSEGFRANCLAQFN